MSNGHPHETDEALLELRSEIARGTVSAWNRENTYWPGIAFIVATSAYTLARLAYEHPPGAPPPRWLFAGELVGAGGPLCGFIMLTSAQYTLHDFLEKANQYNGARDEGKYALEKLKKVGYPLVIIQAFCGMAGLVFAFMQIAVEHHNDDYSGKTTALLLLGNLLFLLAVRRVCCQRIRRAKVYMIDLDNAIS